MDTRDTSLPGKLGFADDDQDIDDVVQQLATTISGLLDTHLTAAQEGTADLSVLGAQWLDETAPSTAEVLRSGITTPDLPVASAAYTMTVHAEPQPVLTVVRIDVTRRDDSTVALELVFDVTGERPVLQVVGPAGGTA